MTAEPSASAAAPEIASPPCGIAQDIARGTQRLLFMHGFVALSEVTLPNGRRADLLALGPKDQIHIVEIKSGLEDFRSDHKWAEYAPYCDTFSFAVTRDFPVNVLPETEGLILADKFGAAFVRQRAPTPLPSARRRVVVGLFARTAAQRLLALADPQIRSIAAGALT